MEVGKRRILIGTSIIATLLVAGPYSYSQWIGESPTYPVCVAAMAG